VASAPEPSHKAAAWLAQTIPPLLAAEGCRPDTCVVHTEVACRAGRAIGVRVQPQAVIAEVHNPAAADWARARGRLHRTHGDGPIKGGHIVVIGEPGPARHGRWAGHLVAVVHGGPTPVIVDLTLPQANRPHKAIALTPGCFPLDPREVVPWLAGAHQAVFELQGSIVAYRALHRRDWRDSPDWATPVRAQLADEDWRARFAGYLPGDPTP